MLAELIRKHPKTNAIDSEVIMRQAYDQSYGIFDYTWQAQMERSSSRKDIKRPLACVAAHIAEDTSGALGITEVFKVFERLQLNQRFGISVLEYLELPRNYARVLCEVAEARQIEDVKQQNKVRSEIENMRNSK